MSQPAAITEDLLDRLRRHVATSTEDTITPTAVYTGGELSHAYWKTYNHVGMLAR